MESETTWHSGEMLSSHHRYSSGLWSWSRCGRTLIWIGRSGISCILAYWWSLWIVFQGTLSWASQVHQQYQPPSSQSAESLLIACCLNFAQSNHWKGNLWGIQGMNHSCGIWSCMHSCRIHRIRPHSLLAWRKGPGSSWMHPRSDLRTITQGPFQS